MLSSISTDLRNSSNLNEEEKLEVELTRFYVKKNKIKIRMQKYESSKTSIFKSFRPP